MIFVLLMECAETLYLYLLLVIMKSFSHIKFRRLLGVWGKKNQSPEARGWRRSPQLSRISQFFG